MGLFGKKFELRREYFDTYFNMSENEIYQRRESQGFNVTRYVDAGYIHIKAEMKSFLSTFSITYKKSVFGNQEECIISVYEMLSFENITTFLKQNFTPVSNSVRFTSSDGYDRNFSMFSVYLNDGNVLAWKSSSGTSWFSLQVISKDRIKK